MGTFQSIERYPLKRTISMMERVTWKERVHRLRRDKGITLERLASSLDMTRAGIGHILAGRRDISVDMLCKLAKLLDTTPEYLLTGAEPVKSEFNETALNDAINAVFAVIDAENIVVSREALAAAIAFEHEELAGGRAPNQETLNAVIVRLDRAMKKA